MNNIGGKKIQLVKKSVSKLQVEADTVKCQTSPYLFFIKIRGVTLMVYMHIKITNLLFA